MNSEPRCGILGVYEPKPFFDTTDADWKHLFNVSVLTGVRLSRACMSGMMNAGTEGCPPAAGQR